MSWFKAEGHRLRYRGVRPVKAFEEWAADAGRPLVDELEAKRRFSLFGKRRAVKRALWRELRAAAQREDVARAVQEGADDFVRLIGWLAAHVHVLPRTRTLRRIVIVPRALVNGQALELFVARLSEFDAIRAFAGGPLLRDFLCVQYVEQLDAAIHRQRPSIRRAIPSYEEWATIGEEREFVWRVPIFRAPEWRGHYYVCEIPPTGLRWADRRKLRGYVEEASAELQGLSRAEREDMLQLTRGYTDPLRQRSIRTCAS
jgi:hypothetical protein